MKVFRKIELIIVLIIFVGCSSEKLLENEEFKKEDISEKLHEKWVEELEDHNIAGIIEEERSNVFKNEILYKKKRIKINTSGKRFYVHYMPWFQSPEIDGEWGQHWTMINKNPDKINRKGKREIASHYYPLIGPYSTKDKDLQQYHLLLMKLCGVDGVIFDWYGKRDVLDFDYIKKGMENFIEELEKTDLEFAVMYEDRVVEVQERRINEIQIQQAKEDIQYIEQNYFTNNNYIQIKENPLLMIFGPNYITSSEDWKLIFNSLETKSEILTLWNSNERIDEEDITGEYAWIDQNHLETLSGYYNEVINFNERTVGGVAYPRFNDFYVEGGWKSALEEDWAVKGRGVKTFKESFNESLNHPVDFIQIATWNDFGEGTQIEPTREFGYKHLRVLQKYTGTSFSKEDLRIPYYIYKLRKEHKNNYTVKFLMNRAHYYAMNNKTSKAKTIIGLTIFYFGYDF